MKPATPLPWEWNKGRAVYDAENSRAEVNGDFATAKADAAYIAHACNAYPRLVAVLLALTETGHTPEDREQKLREARTEADDLLEELGECH